MIRITAKEEKYLYNAYHATKAFYPRKEVEQSIDEDGKDAVCITLENGKEHHVPLGEKREIADRSIYQFLQNETGESLAWGILTGIRPTKIAMGKIEQGQERRELLDWFQNTYYVSKEKAELAYDIAVREKNILKELDYGDGYSLYVGIPFCPSVCSYCSFSSGSIDYWGKYVDQYVDALCKEIRYVGSVSSHKKMNTIYIGGGTPTTLTADQLERLLTCIDETFSREHLLEYTIEAGRPDSITNEKLQVIKAHGTTRISINPQTMQQRTLDVIGRKHTVGQVVETYQMARELGFDNINMDLIAGLPGETSQDMRDTIEKMKALKPDSLTVHSLSIKRAALMGQEKSTLGYVKDLKEQMEDPVKMGEELTAMIEYAAQGAKDMGLFPYYLYRQKNIAGNFENVGYAKVDKAGIYNILIMEEKQSIIAVGAGASTKIVLPEPVVAPGSKSGKKTTLIRIENVKNIREYMDRIDEMIERKGEWLWR